MLMFDPAASAEFWKLIGYYYIKPRSFPTALRFFLGYKTVFSKSMRLLNVSSNSSSSNSSRLFSPESVEFAFISEY